MSSKSITLRDTDALIVVDMQNDFLPYLISSLPVTGGDEIIPTINKYVEIFKTHTRPIVFTRDWHPEGHSSFVEQGGKWPIHCIQNSLGAQFGQKLVIPDTMILISKASSIDKDAYSGFQDTGLLDTLTNLNVARVFICGVATDYCVRATVLDALGNYFSTFLLTDAIKAVNVNKEDGRNAELEMVEKGAIPISLEKLVHDKSEQPTTN